MKVRTVRERDRIQIGGSATDLTKAEASAISKVAPMLPSGALLWEHRALRIGSYCGILTAGDLVLEILPKIAHERPGDADARGVLVAMLRAAGHLVDTPVGSAPLEVQKMHLLDVFVLDFCERVNALLRGGAIRSYELREENIGVLRGRLNLAEHLRLNLIDRGRMHCRFDEFSADNPYNRALKAVLVRLLSHPLGQQAKGAVNSLLRRMEDVSTWPCSAADIKTLHFDRLTRAWEPVFGRGSLFMRGLYPDVRVGKDEGACLLFDMEHLFEAFVGAKLRRSWRAAVGAHVSLQGPQRYFAAGSAGPAFRMRPDITVVASDGRVKRIYDTKWKRRDAAVANRGVTHDDIYQMASYAGRYDCNRLALLYPRDKEAAPGLLESFDLHSLSIPLVEVYVLDLLALVRGEQMPSGLCPPGR